MSNIISSQKTKKSKFSDWLVIIFLILSLVFCLLSLFVSMALLTNNAGFLTGGKQLAFVQTDRISQVKYSTIICYTPTQIASEGDLVLFELNETIYIQNVESVSVDGAGKNVYQTKDSKENLTVFQSQLIGKYEFKLNFISKLVAFCRTQTGAIIMTAVPITLYIVFEICVAFNLKKQKLAEEINKQKAVEDGSLQDGEEIEINSADFKSDNKTVSDIPKLPKLPNSKTPNPFAKIPPQNLPKMPGQIAPKQSSVNLQKSIASVPKAKISSNEKANLGNIAKTDVQNAPKTQVSNVPKVKVPVAPKIQVPTALKTVGAKMPKLPSNSTKK